MTTPTPHVSTTKLIRFIGYALVFFTSTTAHADSTWVSNCSKSNGQSYCQNVDKARSVNIYSDAKIQEFGKLTNNTFDALSELLGGKKQSTADWLAEREAANQAARESNLRDRELLSTRDGRRIYYGERKGKGDPEMDYRYAGTLDKESDVLKWMKSAADGGYPNALYAIALYTERGHYGVPLDLAASQKLMEKAANAGQLTAQGIVAYRLGYGAPVFNVKPNPDLAFRMATVACDKKNMYGCMVLGNFYRDGVGTQENTAKAVTLYNTVVLRDESTTSGTNNVSFENEKGSAAYSLAEIYAYGEGTIAADTPSARSYLLLAINQPGLRVTDAWIAYGNALLIPNSPYALPQQDVKRGLEVFQWFANINNTQAMDILGNLSLYGPYGVPKNVDLGLSWLKKGANLGNVSSMLRLGGYYADVEPQGSELATAFKWIKMAADADSDEGNFLLSLYYFRGWGVAVDKPKYKLALTKACQLNSAKACYEVGVRYLSGAEAEFEKDVVKGRAALASADQNGSGNASLRLAKSYLSDDNMTPDTALLGVRLAASAVQRKANGANEYWQMITTANNTLVRTAVARVRAE